MKAEDRITAFYHLGKKIRRLSEVDFQSLALAAKLENAWFTVDNVRMSLRSIGAWLESTKLLAWTVGYDLHTIPKRIAVVMAGNIPLVGFHDLLCVLIAGHNILIKTSSKDSALIKFIVQGLIEIEPRFEDKIEIAERMKSFDAIIATGSDNTSRYFEYYFSKYPHIIRKNRTSVAIIHGNETGDQINALGTDIFSYFGLGCRNVSKIYVPSGYNVTRLLAAWNSFQDIIHHHKYCNNYDYQKSILLVSLSIFLDNGFLLLQESEKLFSPLAVVYYEYYESAEDLALRLQTSAEKIQCVVEECEGSEFKFGQAQFPSLGNYADQIDTLKFLTTLN
ncbi:MAG: acyl-CoA reductase [Chryseolinea sp.]